jgi:hypothetical protein
VHIVFGTLNTLTATADEVKLSQSVQNALATFVKDPGASPAPNWPAYEAAVSGNTAVSTLAKIAYHGNVQLDDFVEPIDPSSTVSIGNIYTMWHIYRHSFHYEQDGPCNAWDPFLDFRP